MPTITAQGKTFECKKGEIEGEVSELGWRESTRLSVPPHNAQTTRRLACQVQVLGDLTVTKYDGFWGTEIMSNGGQQVAS